jgi:hypothetical protein
LPENYGNHIRDIAYRIRKEFGNVVEAQDLIQSFHLLLVEKPGIVTDWLYLSETDDLCFGWRSFKRDVAGIMAKACKEQQRIRGFVPEDDVVYGRMQLEKLLPFVYHTTVLAAVDTHDERKSVQDPAYGGNLMAAATDTRFAYEKVIRPGSTWDKVLHCLFAFGLSQQATADQCGLNVSTVNRHKLRAMDTILREMNGTLPYREGPGSRSAMSNSASIAETRNH